MKWNTWNSSGTRPTVPRKPFIHAGFKRVEHMEHYFPLTLEETEKPPAKHGEHQKTKVAT